jgi:hypothetical protein
MKIYFEDGSLYAKTSLELGCDHIINAACGYSDNEAAFENIMKVKPDASIYTNSVIAFTKAADYCWDDEHEIFELYVHSKYKSGFERVGKLTGRELRPAHNLFKLWLNGEFE